MGGALLLDFLLKILVLGNSYSKKIVFPNYAFFFPPLWVEKLVKMIEHTLKGKELPTLFYMYSSKADIYISVPFAFDA